MNEFFVHRKAYYQPKYVHISYLFYLITGILETKIGKINKTTKTTKNNNNNNNNNTLFYSNH